MSQTPLFSAARVVPLGGGTKLIFCSGVTARGSAAAGAAVEEQARECLAKLGRSLAAEGADFTHLLKLTTWLSDMRDYDGFNAIRRAAFADLPVQPASTCVGGAQFTTTDCCIEIEAIAVLPAPGATLDGPLGAGSGA
jgi:enamine deaminase RidA (YjgF/YER057c/UK114 family)